MNTKINYMYRDASNYKQHQNVIVKGELTDDQIQKIYASCDEYPDKDKPFDPECEEPIYFIPQQVGLPEIRFEKTTSDDHCWFEMQTIELTDEAPTIDMSADEIFRNFEDVRLWDDIAYAPDYEEIDHEHE